MSEHHSHDVTVSPFGNTTFKRLFGAQITSLIGSGFTQVALALLAFDLMGEQAAVVLAFVWSARVLASVIFAPIFGGLIHRLPRKTWLIGLGQLVTFINFKVFQNEHIQQASSKVPA